jgi:hypothetical protein
MGIQPTCCVSLILEEHRGSDLPERPTSTVSTSIRGSGSLGVPALGEVIGDRFDLEVEFIDLPNEV